MESWSFCYAQLEAILHGTVCLIGLVWLLLGFKISTMSEELATAATAIAIIPSRKTLNKKENEELCGWSFGCVE